ncbi:MAG: NADH-quinone oxidoreductase subunit C [Bryobacteraceae bacterium]|nr:NADH-quinone oxidoreductase subunit C [Bryobacteraceae bacterium]
MITESALARPDVAAAVEVLPEAIACGVEAHGEVTLGVPPTELLTLARYLKEQQGYARLSAVTCVDWHPREPRFEVVYQLHSIVHNRRLRLKVSLPSDAAEVDSVTGIWRSANWYEREVFDLFGVHFRNHPNLRRIMMPEGWVGHPLRKDFPVHGHKYSYQEG